MKTLTKEHISEELSFPVMVPSILYLEEESALVCHFPTMHETEEETVVDDDVILVYTVEYHGQCYLKFVCNKYKEIGPLYIPFAVQDRESLYFGNELFNMYEFRGKYVKVIDDIFHNPNTKATPSPISKNSFPISAKEIIDDERELNQDN
jgi:hypothetical protein